MTMARTVVLETAEAACVENAITLIREESQLKEALSNLHQEVKELLMTYSVALHKQCISRHELLTNQRKPRSLCSNTSDTNSNPAYNEAQFKEIINQFKTTRKNSNHSVLTKRLSDIMKHQRHQEQQDLVAKVNQAKIECARLRKKAVAAAKDSLGIFVGTPIIGSLDGIVEEMELINKGEDLRMRYDILKNVLFNLKSLYQRAREAI